MPIYEFECSQCKAIFETTMKMSDPAPTKCNHCGKGPVTKLVSRTAFQLKGGGWFKEGYDSASNKPKAAETPATKPSTPATSED